MKYLLDVNALVAWWHYKHPKHAIFHEWTTRAGFENLITCGQTELGFLRITMQVYGFSLSEAQVALFRMHERIGGFIKETPSPRLAAWANTGAKTTDAYLCQLASANKLRLATFDAGIKDPAAFLIS